jgi:SAM-dependent methyltransferase
MIHRVIDETVAERRALLSARDDLPFAYQLMGQDGLGCPIKAGAENAGPHLIDFAHSNCVLIQDVIGHSRQIVQEFYGEAATESKANLCCPVPQAPEHLTHIPADLLGRSYGCGSPVLAANLTAGETVVDLGSGTGVECFIASKLVGPDGRAFGVDMTPDMLAVAHEARARVAANLGYANVSFVRGYLEALPLAESSVDVVISNCVINLSPEKLKVFSEIRRVLRPGGRMVIADVVAGREVTDRIKHNPRLKAECIGGALTEEELLILLSKLGFAKVRVESKLAYREVDGIPFFSDTVIAERPAGPAPLPYQVDLEATITAAACCEPVSCCDTGGAETPCCAPAGCGETTDTAAAADCRDAPPAPTPARAAHRHSKGCSVCGQALEYLDAPQEAECYYCGRQLRTRACCIAGHFVCDQCHGGDYLRFVRGFVAQCDETDPLAVFCAMREAFPFPLHGPEHHAMVPAAFLAAYRNSGGVIQPKAIADAISEGAKLPGGTCAYWGGCSAALGMGVAYSAILNASPLKSRGRSAAQAIVARILQRLSDLRAPRCCRRESLIALQVGAELSAQLLPHPLATEGDPTCTQNSLNRECIGKGCPFFRNGGT